MNAIERMARYSGSGYLERAWREANGNWMTPNENDIRAFLSVIARDVPADQRREYARPETESEERG